MHSTPITMISVDHAPLDHDCVHLLSTAPRTQMLAGGTSLPTTGRLVGCSRIINVICVPTSFSTHIKHNRRTVCVVCDAAATFLCFTSVRRTSTKTVLTIGSSIQPRRIIFLPRSSVRSIIRAESISIMNATLCGCASNCNACLVPTILVIIVFRALVFIVDVLDKGRHRAKSVLVFTNPRKESLSFLHVTSMIVKGSFACLIFCTLFSIFLLKLLPLIFRLPRLTCP